MAAEENDYEPKLTVKLRSEITEPEPFEYTVLKPAKPIEEPEDEEESTIGLEPEQSTIDPEGEEERFEETMESTDTAKVQKVKPERKKARKSSFVRKSPTRSGPENKPISKLHSELRRHSDARKRTDLAILDIRKELKDLLLVHHATIKDLKKQVSQMHRKIATIDASTRSTKSKTTAKKKTRNKKIPSSKKPKKDSNVGKNKRKR